MIVIFVILAAFSYQCFYMVYNLLYGLSAPFELFFVLKIFPYRTEKIFLFFIFLPFVLLTTMLSTVST